MPLIRLRLSSPASRVKCNKHAVVPRRRDEYGLQFRGRSRAGVVRGQQSPFGVACPTRTPNSNCFHVTCPIVPFANPSTLYATAHVLRGHGELVGHSPRDGEQLPLPRPTRLTRSANKQKLLRLERRKETPVAPKSEIEVSANLRITMLQLSLERRS